MEVQLGNRITLIRSRDVWYLHYVGPHAEQMHKRYGTCVIASKYDSRMSKEQVIEDLRKTYREDVDIK